MTTPDSEGANRKRVLAHFERHLGETVGGWSQDAAGVQLPFDVLRFDGVPHGGCASYATVGLSEHKLSGPRKDLRLELIMGLSAAAAPPVSVLAGVGEEILARHQALLRGEVVKVGGEIDWLYATVPVYYPDALAQFDDVAVVWLVPVRESEAQFVKRHGWDAFEDRVADADPDLTDLRRSPVA